MPAVKRSLRAVGAGLVATLAAGSMVTVLDAPSAQAAGVVTHSWMALDAIEHVRSDALRALLDAQRDQVRAGAEFPDGGYITRSLGTPGGDYGEESHWQRFTNAYADEIRNDPDCADLTDPAGPCAAQIAHLMGAAGHGMGDEVWDWLFEPNGPGFDEPAYRPPDIAPFTGPGGLEAQMDIVAIARHGRPVDPTVELPDAQRIVDAYRAINRLDIDIDALAVGEQGLEVERSVEAYWASVHLADLERAMPWTSANMTSSAGGVAFAAMAIAGYYDTLWARILGTSPRGRVSVTAPAPGATTVPATGWVRQYSPGSNDGNAGGLRRIAAVLTNALPFNPEAPGGGISNELPAGSMQLRDLRTGTLVAPLAGYPRIVPYGADAGEHVVAFQPATDLAPCRWYRAEITEVMRDASDRPVRPMGWRFRTSGCTRRGGEQPVAIQGTVTCAADGIALAGDEGGVLARLEACDGGQDGTPLRRAGLPIAAGALALSVQTASGDCAEFATPSGDATVEGAVRWDDAQGRAVGWSLIARQRVDPRGGTLRVANGSGVLPGASLAFRLPPLEAGACTPGAAVAIPRTRVTAWSR